MISKEVLDTVVKFQKTPDTEEKLTISRRYLTEEIGTYGFYCQARQYLESIGDSSGPDRV
jgi:hypothetical protein